VSQLEAAKQLLEREPTVEAPVKSHPFKRVLNDHLIVQIDTFKYTGRIIVPETAKRKPTKGVVIALAKNITDIEVGDKILYSQFAGYLLKFGDMPTFRCIGYAEVLAVLDNDAPEIEAEGA
jgi:co-chaperonin GroES (HSP10)